MKTFQVWKIVVVGVVLSILATEVRADDKAKMEQKAKAALALSATAAQPGFVNLAPVPRSIPEPMPAAKCPCGSDCKCEPGKCPAGCPATAKKVAPAVVPAMPTWTIVGYNQRCYMTADGKRYCVQEPVYELR